MATRQTARRHEPHVREQHPRGEPGDGHHGASGGLTVQRLQARVAELERERDHLVATVDILHSISAASHFTDVLQTITRKLGDAFRLDRCSIYLAGDRREVRLVATYEDAAVRNLIVDVERYPELKRALKSGETVWIPDTNVDPMLRPVRSTLARRNVQSIVVAPIRSGGATIGAIFLRTERNSPPFTERDVRFCQVIASLTANALRTAHRAESLARPRPKAAEAGAERHQRQQRMLLALLRRLLDRYAPDGAPEAGAGAGGPPSPDELERLIAAAAGVMAPAAG
jgi:GAF domain-containing protein